MELQGVCKKFCSDIKWNLYYCFTDILKQQVGLSLDYQTLRPKEFWALDNISLQLRKGCVTGMVGMNGSGKTTLSRVISGIFQPDIGSLESKQPLRITPIFALKAGIATLIHR